MLFRTSLLAFIMAVGIRALNASVIQAITCVGLLFPQSPVKPFTEFNPIYGLRNFIDLRHLAALIAQREVDFDLSLEIECRP